MLSKAYNLAAMMSLAMVLAGGGVTGYLAATGRLSAERLERAAAALRGGAALETAEGGLSAASQPVGEGSEILASPSADAVREQRAAEHMQSLRLERAKQDVAARLRLLEQAQQSLIREQERFEDARQSWKAQQSRADELARDEGFQRELAYVAGLPPKQAKEHLIRTWNKQPVDAIRLVMALDVGKGKRILEQFKTAEELEIMHALLERVRIQQPESAAAAPGKAGGVAAP